MSWFTQESICFSPVFVSSRGRWSRVDVLTSGYHQEAIRFWSSFPPLCMASTLKVTSKILQITIWLTGSPHWKKREKGGQKGTCKLRYLQTDFSETPTMAVSSTCFSVDTPLQGNWDMFSFSWIDYYFCHTGVLIVKNKRNNENLAANSHSLPLVKPLIFTFCESLPGITKWWCPCSWNSKYSENQTIYDIPSLNKYRICVLIHFGIVWFCELQLFLSSCGLKKEVMVWFCFDLFLW